MARASEPRTRATTLNARILPLLAVLFSKTKNRKLDAIWHDN